jgi:RimK family alpha-L-glutamate ligase
VLEDKLLKIGIVTRNPSSYSSAMLLKALENRNIPHRALNFRQLTARVGFRPYFSIGKRKIEEELDALIIRPIGRGSLEEIVFRMDLLYRLQRLGMLIVNPPEAIEHCVDKFDIVALLEENGIRVPRTVATESVSAGLEAFEDLGGDVVVKPLFGSRGVGATRVKDKEIASTVFRSIIFYHGVIYIQEYVPHGVSDIRALVVGDNVIASMRRVGTGWKTNYSQGAHPEAMMLEKPLEDIAVKASKSIGCKVGGVDILESQKGPTIVEVNSQPGWKGLQSVTSVNIAEGILDFVLSELRK